MWADVYEQNANNILDVLDNYIEKIIDFRELIAAGNFEETYQLMESANEIGRILTRNIQQKTAPNKLLQ